MVPASLSKVGTYDSILGNSLPEFCLDTRPWWTKAFLSDANLAALPAQQKVSKVRYWRGSGTVSQPLSPSKQLGGL